MERRKWNTTAGGVEPWRPPLYSNAHYAEEERICYELRLRGLSIRQIADATSLPPTTVYRRLSCAIEATLAEPREQVLRLELDRLDRLQQVVAGIIERPHYLVAEGRVVRTKVGTDDEGEPVYEPLLDDGPVLAAMDRWLKIQDRRAKYLKLDAPTAFEVDATVTETTQRDLEIIDLINTSRAKAAADEALLTDHPEESP